MKISELFNLQGRVALVTGGSRGLGFQMAEALGEMGAEVIITARKEHELEQACSSLKIKKIDVSPIVSDLQDIDKINDLVDGIVKEHEKIDILVNNAGTAWGSPAEDHPIDAWEKVLHLNLTAMFALSQSVGKKTMIKRQSGKIINIASIAGLVGTDPDFMPTIAYNSSKGGVVNFTRSLAAEWAKYNINVNAIAPGVFPSKMSSGMIDRAENYILKQTPLNRLGSDFDLKGLCVLLASEASNYITGQTVAVDGGFSAI